MHSHLRSTSGSIAVSRFIILLLLHALLIPPLIARPGWAQEPFILTVRSGETEQDVRYSYDNTLLKLALDKTVATDGPYTLRESGSMNFARAKQLVLANSLPNFFIKLSYDAAYTDTPMRYVPFPVDLGIVGYRVCFAHPEVVMKLRDVEDMEELRRFSHGQGLGWTDTRILRHNGFTVQEVPAYESLFKMVAARRFDLFCRGTNELLGEFRAHPGLPGLAYDRSMTIHYPLPRLFYTHASNTEALDRITRGILLAYEDGSLLRLWQEEYQESIDFVNLEKRRVFHLDNPYLEGIGFDYSQYFYTPSR